MHAVDSWLLEAKRELTDYENCPNKAQSSYEDDDDDADYANSTSDDENEMTREIYPELEIGSRPVAERDSGERRKEVLLKVVIDEDDKQAAAASEQVFYIDPSVSFYFYSYQRN